MRGSEHNDAYILGESGRVRTATNHAGGALGGLTSGMPLIVRAAIKPTSSIGRAQRSVDLGEMREVDLTVEGRHDPCIALRAWVPAIAVTALALTDLMLTEGMLP
jgi:chorismate synthase